MGQAFHPIVAAIVALVGCAAVSQTMAAEATSSVNVMQTPAGTRFGVLSAKPAAPAPTLFIFAYDIEDTFASDTYTKICRIVAQHGVVCVSMDLPFHPGPGLDGWAAATQQRQPWLAEFTARASDVLDRLIESGYTDPRNVAVAGTSRGGFAAMHVAAADSRFRCAIGFVPVTDLTQLTEFVSLKDDPFAHSLSLSNIAEKLVGRSILISIGNNDDRVNTDKAIEFARTLVKTTLDNKQFASTEIVDVELHVMPWPGHGGERVLDAHDVAAAWLLGRMK